jgi:osmoprotectant transport system substrate-binding protein
VVPIALALAACSGAPGSPTPAGARQAVRIGSFDFPESELLARIYGLALRQHGIPVSLSLDLGSREIVEPALQQGFVDLVPEYAGSALEFVTVGGVQATANPSTTHRLLARALDSRGLRVLASAPAQDQNAVVVTARTAKEDGIRSVADLAPLAQSMVFGGPPECSQRPFCLPGLQRSYGLRFKQFVPLDAGGPYTVDALKTGAVDVAMLFTTDGDISPNRFVILRDDRRLQPAENVTPVVRRSVLGMYGATLVDVLNSVSARLTTADLAHMNELVSLARSSPSTVASDWLTEHGLVG